MTKLRFKNKDKLTFAALLCALSIPLLGAPSGLRMVFLNGVDISTARGQQLRKVDIQISENGDIYIVAPHYQVHEEDSYVPLSQYVQGVNTPAHLPPHASSGLTQAPPDRPIPTQPIAKPGVPMSPPAGAQSVKEANPPAPPPEDADLEASDESGKGDTKESPPPSPEGQPLAQSPGALQPTPASKANPGTPAANAKEKN